MNQCAICRNTQHNPPPAKAHNILGGHRLCDTHAKTIRRKYHPQHQRSGIKETIARQQHPSTQGSA